MIQEIIFLNQKKVIISPTRTGNAFSSNYFEYKGNGDKDKSLSIKEYIDMIRPYLSGIINNYKTQGEWKIKLTMAINFFSSKDSEEIHNRYSPSDNLEVIIGIETDEIIEEHFDSFLQRYQKGFEESIKRNKPIFDSVDSLYYKLPKTSLNRGGSYIDSPEWLENKKATINPNNNDDKCFQYAVTVALNYQSIKKVPQRIWKFKPFIDQYNWKEIDLPSQKKKKKKKKTGKSLNQIEKIRHAYKSKHNLKRKNQVIFLMITDGKNSIILL